MRIIVVSIIYNFIQIVRRLTSRLLRIYLHMVIILINYIWVKYFIKNNNLIYFKFIN